MYNATQLEAGRQSNCTGTKNGGRIGRKKKEWPGNGGVVLGKKGFVKDFKSAGSYQTGLLILTDK